MSFLDDLAGLQALDKAGALASVEALADQVRQTFADGQNWQWTPEQPICNVVVTGMGGSALGGDIVQHLYLESLSEPLTLVRGYNLPAWVDSDTLVIACSYSGNTEETLEAAHQALEKKAQLVVLSSGGELERLASEHNLPYFKIVPTHNPSNSPRMALGYSLIALQVILSKAGLISFGEKEAKEIELAILATDERCRQSVATDDNPAKLLALEILDRRPVIFGADFLEGAIHVATNQLNESAKTFADYKMIPELNHHLMEGLQFPLGLAATTFFILIQSQLYRERNQKRLQLVTQLLTNKEYDHRSVILRSETRLTQVFELITMMSYASFYLAMLEKVDPTPNPEVDWFKKELTR